MNRKWLFAGTLSAGIVALGLSSAALADDDRYCARPSSQQNVHGDRYAAYGNDGYDSARPYDAYEGNYSQQDSYGSPYGGYPDTQYRYSQPDSRYGREAYGQYDSRYGRDARRQHDSRYGRDRYRGQGYGGGVVHEDHTRSTFRLFPFPHVDKRTVHHQHPTYPY